MKAVAKKPSKSAEKPQIERFREAVRDMVTAGELNPTEADKAFDRLLSQQAHIVNADTQDI